MDDDDTGLCGLTTATDSFTALSGCSGEVTVKYCLRVVTGHSSLLCGNDGKVLCQGFALSGLFSYKTAGRKTIPSGLNQHLSIRRDAKSTNQEGLVSASNMYNLRDSCFNESEMVVPIPLMYSSNAWTFHVTV